MSLPQKRSRSPSPLGIVSKLKRRKKFDDRQKELHAGARPTYTESVEAFEWSLNESNYAPRVGNDFTIPELLAIAPAIILWAVRDNPDYQKVPYKCKWSINDLHAIVRPELRQAELREGNQGDGVVYLGFMHAEKDKGVMPIKIRNKHLFLDQKCEGSKAVYGKLSQTPVLDASQSNNRSLPGIQLCDKDGKVCSEDHIEVDPLELGGKKYAELCIRHDQVELQSARRINAYRLQNWASCRLLFFGKGLPFMHKPHPFYTPQLMIYDPHENPSSTEGRVVPTQALERGNQCLLSQLSQRAVRGGDGEDGKS